MTSSLAVKEISERFSLLPTSVQNHAGGDNAVFGMVPPPHPPSLTWSLPAHLRRQLSVKTSLTPYFLSVERQ